MEIGNRLSVSRNAIENHPGLIVNICVFNCLKACEQYGIEPVGSFRMEHLVTPYEWDEVRYIFDSDASELE